MIMYEVAADVSAPQQPITIDEVVAKSSPGIQIHRQGLFAQQASRTSPTFLSLNLSTTPNFLVAVFLRFDPARKAEYDRYYTEKHMDAIAKGPGWRRTRRLVNVGLPEGVVELG